MGNTVVRDRQSLMDVAVQHAGSIEAAFDMSVQNNISMSDDLGTGIELLPGETTNKRKVKLYKNENIIPAMRDDVSATKKGGINYMQIGTDFKVS